VTIKNSASAIARKKVTGAEGRFEAAGPPPGTYSVEAVAQGFAADTRTGIQLAAGASQDVSLHFASGQSRPDSHGRSGGFDCP